jgi:hypothetical protein
MSKQNEFSHIDDDQAACWGCGKLCYDQQLADVTFPVCERCWKVIPVQHRLWLQLVSRAAGEGGVGLRELMQGSIDSGTAADWFRHLYGPGQN